MKPLPLYPNRTDDQYLDYIEYLVNKLKDVQFQKKNSILYTEEDKKKYKKFKKYNRYIKIYFTGIACRTLLGQNVSDEKSDSKIASKFKDFLRNKDGIISKLNAAGIRVKIRFLFPYPYSDFFYSMVDAQKNAMVKSTPPNYSFDLPESKFLLFKI